LYLLVPFPKTEDQRPKTGVHKREWLKEALFGRKNHHPAKRNSATSFCVSIRSVNLNHRLNHRLKVLIMQALEMEEVESLVGAGSRRKLAANRNNSNSNANSNDLVASAVTNRSFMTNVIAVAGIAFMALLYISASDAGEAKANTAGHQQVKGEGSPAPAMPPISITVGNGNEDGGPGAGGGPPVAPPTSSPVNPSPPVNPQTAPTTPAAGNYMYSKYATILPLIDHPLPDDAKKAALAETWGSWHFWDGEEDMRPSNDYLAKYPHRDIPGDEFPEDAWQTDAVFVNHYLNDADLLLSRTMEAIFSEYGHGKPLSPQGMADRMKMFHWSKEDLSTAKGPPEKYSKRGDHGNGGWTTARSFDGLVKRLLHAMMTSDTFTVVMGGHSAAVGQGYVR
jgi:hypothetical protein